MMWTSFGLSFLIPIDFPDPVRYNSIVHLDISCSRASVDVRSSFFRKAPSQHRD